MKNLILLFVLLVFFGCQREYLISQTEHVDYVVIHTIKNEEITCRDVSVVLRYYKIGPGIENDKQDYYKIIFKNEAENIVYLKDIKQLRIVLEKSN